MRMILVGILLAGTIGTASASTTYSAPVGGAVNEWKLSTGAFSSLNKSGAAQLFDFSENGAIEVESFSFFVPDTAGVSYVASIREWSRYGIADQSILGATLFSKEFSATDGVIQGFARRVDFSPALALPSNSRFALTLQLRSGAPQYIYFADREASLVSLGVGALQGRPSDRFVWIPTSDLAYSMTVSAVPEPTPFAMMSLGITFLVGVAVRRRKD
ncbi:PEP-CTERM sorting domain-containing protein [Niveibacterium microcysteis]|uniref:PEP-CTERM sorting domain-containing protein n=1 Tax=Niveibacterium microcysteis TaxID=2811415 RepID=A0ABX7M8X4_9RHOO|nr:PEP-CTERM sorting domain-containing protein [Niveibacterium microcysteis]QSI77864.1 PEP-CTERM sorting domain-containing protein [Niveibacterium microcysteis]